jgi:hypothetical protein
VVMHCSRAAVLALSPLEVSPRVKRRKKNKNNAFFVWPGVESGPVNAVLLPNEGKMMDLMVMTMLAGSAAVACPCPLLNTPCLCVLSGQAWRAGR